MRAGTDIVHTCFILPPTTFRFRYIRAFPLPRNGGSPLLIRLARPILAEHAVSRSADPYCFHEFGFFDWTHNSIQGPRTRVTS